MEYKKPWKTFIGFNLRVDLARFWNPKNETCKDCRCQNMADKQLGAESRALLFSLLNACKILLVFLLILNYANANSTCTVTQLTIIRGDGTTQCEDCPKCPPGQGLSLKCGSLIPDPETHITCEHCSPGESYSDKDDILQCKECDSCMEGQDVVHPCDERTNVECGKSCSSPNRYFDKKRGCLNCSCCGEGNHTVEEECKRKLGAGSNMICSFNSSAPGCEFTSPLPQADPTRSHVVTTRLVDQSSSDFITPSPQTEITSSHVVTAGLFNQSISSRDFITPSQQTVTTTNQDAATSKPVTSSINHPKKINEPSLIAVVIVSFLVLFGIVVATLYFLHPESMQRCWKCRNEAAIDPQMGIELGQNPGERTPMVPKESGTKEGVTTASRCLQDEGKVEEEEEEPKGLSRPLLYRQEPVQSTSVDCQQQDRRNKATVPEEGVETPTTGHQGDSEVNFEEKEENGGGRGEEEEPLLVKLENLCANRQKQDSTSKEYRAEEGVRTTVPTDQQDEVKVEEEKKDDDDKEEAAAAAAADKQEEEEEDRKPLLEKETSARPCWQTEFLVCGSAEQIKISQQQEPVQSTSVDCPQQDRKNKDSKHLESLLDKIDTLDKICYRLDAHVTGRGNYRVVAQHYGFTHFEIKSVLEKSDCSPTRALIEYIVTGHPDLTVEEFATVVEEKAKRKDVSNLLRDYDSP